LDGVSIEGYGVSIGVFSSALPEASGCNLKLVSSRIARAWAGIWSSGCDGFPAQTPMAVEIGDATPTHGNTFTSAYRSGQGVGVSLGGCVRGSFRNNVFTNSDAGIILVQSGVAKNSFVVTNNTFMNLNNYGIAVAGAGALVTELANNSFSSISAIKASLGFPGVGLVLDSETDVTAPRVVKARKNRFFGNDAGVSVRGASALLNYPVSDFGTAEDPGSNVFSCNGLPNNVPSPFTGGDVLISSDAAAGVTLPFSGNQWDHDPPTPGPMSSMRPNGTDVLLFSPNVPPTVDTSHAGVSLDPCPDGQMR
jgi:hypothetical protein